ncbi:hypothetical protein NKG05_04390 [Oerskovia sp. M15]
MTRPPARRRRSGLPALADAVALRVTGSGGEPISVDEATAALTGQLLVAQRGGTAADAPLTAATGVQLPGVLDDLFAEDAADRTLGASIYTNGKWASFALWAPRPRRSRSSRGPARATLRT